MTLANTTHNRVINHVAVHVPDLEAAVDWYTKLFGFQRINSAPITCDRSTSSENSIFRLYGTKLHKVKIAFLSAGNGVGFELFQFIDPPMTERADFEKDYPRGGFFHIAVTDPDPEALLAKVIQEGGKQIGETQEVPDPNSGEGVSQHTLYSQDPWGNVVEICSCSFEKLLGNRW
ncbi:dioxygenase superfamily protein [Aaosphaeria arxii CBS 175.79]|uniref:Dioxygenase superfamily protein n=1 Tax=Aaosphaeria arxii CBS 175.79 TaxID=1450172 RepID=A0A6A5Y2P9_9PLEO|nr:dioxygenase superfamily protein [Aaosphaeria arxii CBS 175.79]KAF2019822.1 dioxygenase superfamily protein [Aaosphaeria arxii CBS 175.79]